MTYAIIGSGAIGTALARQFFRNGVKAGIANSRGPQSLVDLVGELGSTIAAIPVAAALQADIVILAVPFAAIPGIVRATPGWNGRIVIDASNAIDFPAFTPTDLGGRPSSEIVAEAVPGARVVKAFNTLPAALLATDPKQSGGRRVLFLSGNHAEANAQAASLIEALGFAPVDLGKLSEGGRLQQFGGALPVLDLIRMG
ncbi:MAG: NADPH-dependent F420 reductase [Rhizobiales bacterium]|nr:NADPH-dependent F420 reductase [Hyphomicrobiales bacterium]